MNNHSIFLKFQRSMVMGTAFLLVSGCASIGKNDCLEGDWNSVGQTDGANGRVANQRLEAHTKACGKHGVQPNQSLYMEGYVQGLPTYCTTENGYTVGSKFRQNSSTRSGYKSVCPTELELGYLKGYVKGLKNNLDNQRSELFAEESELKSEQTAALVLDVLKSSKAKDQDRKVKRLNSSVRSKKSAVQDISNEFEKWMVAKPELKDI